MPRTVRQLFELYLKLGNVGKLQAECQHLGLRTKAHTTLEGRHVGGKTFCRGHLYRILSSPLYIGRTPHGHLSYEGEHEAIVDQETWNKAQAQLAANAGRQKGRLSSKHPSPLVGRLFTAEGMPFTPSHAVNHGRRYRYYIERSLVTTQAPNDNKASPRSDESSAGLQSRGWRLPALAIERLVFSQLVTFLRDRGKVLSVVSFKKKSPDVASAALARAAKMADACEGQSTASQAEVVAALVRRISVAQDKVTIELTRKTLAARLLDQAAAHAPEAKSHGTITLEVPVRFRRRGVEAKLVVLDFQHSASEPDANLVKALARAHEWFGRIVRGEADGIGAIARAEGLDRAYVTRILCLAFLAPDIARTVLDGRQAPELTAKRLIRSALNLPLLWPDQVDMFRC